MHGSLSSIKHSLLLFTKYTENSLPPAVSAALSEHTESKAFQVQTNLQYWSSPHLILFCLLKQAFSLGWLLFKAIQRDLCQWRSLTSFHRSGSPLGPKYGLLDHDRQRLIGRIRLDKRRAGFGEKKTKTKKSRTPPSAFVVMSIKAWRSSAGSLFQLAITHMGFIFHQDRQSARPIAPQLRPLFSFSAWFPAFEKSSKITFISPEKCV